MLWFIRRWFFTTSCKLERSGIAKINVLRRDFGKPFSTINLWNFLRLFVLSDAWKILLIGVFTPITKFVFIRSGWYEVKFIYLSELVVQLDFLVLVPFEKRIQETNGFQCFVFNLKLYTFIVVWDDSYSAPNVYWYEDVLVIIEGCWIRKPHLS